MHKTRPCFTDFKSLLSKIDCRNTTFDFFFFRSVRSLFETHGDEKRKFRFKDIIEDASMKVFFPVAHLGPFSDI